MPRSCFTSLITAVLAVGFCVVLSANASAQINYGRTYNAYNSFNSSNYSMSRFYPPSVTSGSGRTYNTARQNRRYLSNRLSIYSVPYLYRAAGPGSLARIYTYGLNYPGYPRSASSRRNYYPSTFPNRYPKSYTGGTGRIIIPNPGLRIRYRLVD